MISWILLHAVCFMISFPVMLLCEYEESKEITFAGALVSFFVSLFGIIGLFFAALFALLTYGSKIVLFKKKEKS